MDDPKVPNEGPDDTLCCSRSLRWVATSRGNRFSDSLTVPDHLSRDDVTRLVLEAAESKARRELVGWDPFNVELLITSD